MQWFIILLTVASVVAANVYIEPQIRVEIITKLKKILNNHKSHLHGPELKDDDLYCKCNDAHCDHDIIEIAGNDFRGICRVPRGGQCHTVKSLNNIGDLAEVHLQCLNPDILVPPKRPFQCHNNEYDDSEVEMSCCDYASLCNDVDASFYEDMLELKKITIPKLHPKFVGGQLSLQLFVILLIVAAIIFSGLGICIGLFWLSNTRTKIVLRRIFSRIPIISALTRAGPPQRQRAADPQQIESNALIELSNAYRPDEQGETQDSSGFGLASLSRRTIARQIQLRQTLAKGRFGEVWLGDWRGEQVAVKIFNSRDERSWWRETEIYTTNTLRHANILRWIASDNKDAGAFTQLWLVTEYIPHGSLYDYLETNTITKNVGLQMMRSMLHGLSYLHAEVPGIKNQCYKPPIAHRDLKSKNILVKNDLTCCVADLGLSLRFMHGKMEDVEEKRVGTIRYLAPELFNEILPKKFINFLQADIYAVSLMMWEIARRMNFKGETGSFPYELPYFEHIERDPSLEEMAEIVVEKKLRPTIDSEWYDDTAMSELIRIMEECWSDKAASRLTSLNIRNTLDKLLHTANVLPIN
uniref:Serine/threonine-protein kinase receptor n=1 Tax=Panagrolaimus superbus TaxID=310955 RepID=A0A914Z178_9BILA